MVDLSIIYSKTGKGLRARNAADAGLSTKQLKLLSFIDGKSKAEEILTQSNEFNEKELAGALKLLEADGFIRPLVTQSKADDWVLTSNFTPMVVEEFKTVEEIEAEAHAKAEQEKQDAERIAEEKSQEKIRWKAEINARKEAEAKEKARLAQERVAREAQVARKKQEDQQRRDNETRAKAEEEAKLKAQADAKRKAQEEADRLASAEAKENARREIDRINREAAQAQKEAEEKAKIEAQEQEQKRLEIEHLAQEAAREAEIAKKKVEAEAQLKMEEARLETERLAKSKQAQLEAERLAKAENDAQLEIERKAKAEQKVQEAAELARIKQLEKKQADAEVKEQARFEMANIVRKAEEERKQAEATAKEARQETKRKIKAEEQARIKAVRKVKQDAEQALIEVEAAEKNKIALQKNIQENSAQLEVERIADEAKVVEDTNKNADLKALAQAEQIRLEQAEADKANLEQARVESMQQEVSKQVIEDKEHQLAAREKAEKIRANAEAEEQAALEARKIAQQEMARIAREADALRAQDSNVPTKPVSSKSTLNKPRSDKPTKTKFAKSRFSNTKFDKTKRGRTKSTDGHGFEDSYTDQENKAAKNADIKAKNTAIIEARDAANRANKAGKWQKLSTKIQEQAKNYMSNINVGKWLAKLLKVTLIYVPLLAILCVGLLSFVNINPLISPIQKLASDSFGKPVTIKEVHASLWPQPHLMLGDVAIGDTLKATAIQATPDISTLFENVKRMQSLTISGLTIEQNNVDESLQLIQKLGTAPSLKIEQFNLSDCRFKLNDLVLEPFDGKLVLNDAHELNYVDLHNADQTLSAQIKTQGSQYDVRLTATHWPLPLNPKIVFDELKAHGTLTQNQLIFSEINGAMFGGNITSKATLNWSSGWQVSSDFTLTNANTQQLLSTFASSAKIDGKANLTGTFASQSTSAALLLDKPTVVASVDLSNGKINGVDLVHAVMFNQSASLMGNATSFDKLTANLQLKNEQYQYKQISLDNKQFDASGDVTIEQNQAITGRVKANLVAQSRRLQANFSLAGSINNVKRQ